MRSKPFNEELEMEELIQKLTGKGYGKLVECFLLNEVECFTRRGRLNLSGACRVLGCTTKELKTALKECSDILSKEKD